MGSLAIHQFQQVTDSNPTDVLAAVRTSGVTPEEIQIPRSKIGMEIIVSDPIIIPSADVLTLNATPVELIAGVTGMVIVPKQIYMAIDNGTIDYATNVVTIGGTESLLSDTHYTISNELPLIALSAMGFVGYSFSGQKTGMISGDGLYLSIKTGNPTAGDGDLVCVVIYTLWEHA